MNESNRRVLEYLSNIFQTPDHRFYFVGKLVKQDLVGPEPGYRDTLTCPECREYLVVMGPSVLNTFSALCMNDLLCHNGVAWKASTLQELWDKVHDNISSVL